jgi:hypothetical protein
MTRNNPMPPGRWDEVMYRDNYKCQATRHGFPTSSSCTGRPIVHHKQARGMGGTTDPTIHDLDNLVTLCGGVTGRDGHHGEVHDNPATARACGLTIPKVIP